MAKKPKTFSLRGVTPVGMASFPHLFTPNKIKPEDPNEVAKFRLTHIYKVPDFDDASRAAFYKMITNVNEVCRRELHKTFSDDQVAAFEAALEADKDKPLKAHFAAFRTLLWFDKELQADRSCRTPFLLGKNDQYVDDDAVYIRLTTKADRPPEVVDQLKRPVKESQIYGGALVRASYTAWPYDNLGNRGVTLYLGNVQLCGEGTRIGGGPSASDEFDEVEVDSSADDVAF